jgi:hypothetical protein
MNEQPNWRAALWLRRHRIRGKKRFIWSIVIGRLAFPAAAVVTLGRLFTEPYSAGHFVLHAVGNSVAAVIGGYLGGMVLWDLVVNRGGRRLEPDQPEPQPTSRHHAP